MTTHSTEQLALFMNARDVRDYGTAAWEDLDLAGQEAYLTDASAFVSAMKALGWTPPADAPEPQRDEGHLRGHWSNGDPVHIITDGVDRWIAPNHNGATWIEGEA